MQCTGCGESKKQEEIVASSTIKIGSLPEEIKIYFCSSCTNSLKDFDLDLSKEKPIEAEDVKHEDSDVLRCSFCNIEQRKTLYLFKVIRYYRTKNRFGSHEIHPVAHDKMFLFTHADKKPEKIAEVFICEKCSGLVEKI